MINCHLMGLVRLACKPWSFMCFTDRYKITCILLVVIEYNISNIMESSSPKKDIPVDGVDIIGG